MRIRTSTMVLTITVVLASVWPAAAYDAYRMSGEADCWECHTTFRNEGALHELHVGAGQMTDTCRLCHTQNEDIPRIWTSGTTGGQGCRGCHGRDDGSQFGWGAGIRKHHANAGVAADSNGEFCVDCHTTDAPIPLGEDTLPVYYTRTDVNITDPCETSTGAGGEDYNGDGKGLDNDGDLDYDANDSNCGATAVSDAVILSAWGRVKTLYR